MSGPVLGLPAGAHIVRGLDVDRVRLSDEWLAPRQIVSGATGLPALLDRYEEHGLIDRFRHIERPNAGLHFWDSDVYKWVEAAAWSIGGGTGPDLSGPVDQIIDLIVAAQEPNGYVHTYWPPEGRYSRLFESHDLYCAGHLMQAAVAVHRMTGDERLLSVARRFADHIVTEFGPEGRDEVDAHPEVEMALVELARETGEERYVGQAALFLDRSAPGAMTRMAGHAVRCLYYGAGLTDVRLDGRAASHGGSVRDGAEERLWRSLLDAHHYVTGAVGGRWLGESVGRPYELPNESAYAETCAAVAVVLWAWRRVCGGGADMHEAAELLERSLYNAVLAGIGLDGTSYFYASPLASAAEAEPYPWRYPTDYQADALTAWYPLQRKPWFACPCCLGNVHRLLQMMPGMVYATSDASVWVHLLVSSHGQGTLPDGRSFTVSQEAGSPWRGGAAVTLAVEAGPPVQLRLRVPSWAVAPCLEGEPVGPGYANVTIDPTAGTRTVTLDFDLEPSFLVAHPRVAENRGAVAVQRGPLVYCAEGVDHSAEPWMLRADPSCQLAAEHDPGLLGGVTVLRGTAVQEPEGTGLYRPHPDRSVPAGATAPLTLVPYAVWGNRGLSTMAVWLRSATSS